MAASYHTRSNSFPTRSITLVSQFDEQISRLRSSESASCSSINSQLTSISGLYDCIYELLHFPSSQKAFIQGQKSVEDSLEKSIKFLDVCTTITDVLVQMKERSQELQSILRRRCSKDEIAMEVAKYLRSRKMAVKVVSKTLKDLKKMENDEVIDEVSDVVGRLRECQVATLGVLESVLVVIGGVKMQRSNWESVVSKMLKSKRRERETFFVAFEASDVDVDSEEVRCALEKMEISIKSVEDGVEILFRHLIKTRTSILNKLNC